jgi:hypothetical protein
MDLSKIRQNLLEETGELNYQTNVDGESFQIDVSLGSNGIDLVFTPTNPEGDMILNLSEEEMATLKNSLMTQLTPKFSRYNLELSADDIKGDNKQIEMSISAGSIFPFIKNIIKR